MPEIALVAVENVSPFVDVGVSVYVTASGSPIAAGSISLIVLPSEYILSDMFGSSGGFMLIVNVCAASAPFLSSAV